MIVSPTLMVMAIQVIKQVRKDAAMREAADQIRDEVARLVKDVGLLGDRVRKLQGHFNQSNEDIRLAIISVAKIEAHGERIQQVEVGAHAPASADIIPAPITRRLEAGE
jgi:DNA recombination protein RmuC